MTGLPMSCRALPVAGYRDHSRFIGAAALICSAALGPDQHVTLAVRAAHALPVEPHHPMPLHFIAAFGTGR